MDFCSMWDKHMRRKKSRAVWATEAITNHHKCHPSSQPAHAKGFLPLAAPCQLCDHTAPGKPFLTAANLTGTDQAQFFTPTGPAAEGDTCYFKSSAYENLVGFPWKPVGFPAGSCLLFVSFKPVNSPLVATLPEKLSSRQRAAMTGHSNFNRKYVYAQL